MQALIEQLKERLTSCLDEERNVTDMTGALDVIGRLENTVVTKEALEATRLGAFVNDIRKRYAQTQPDLSKRCRNLIKEWQKLLTPATTGGASTSVNSAVNSPATGGALVTPRGSAAKLVAAGLICSPSPSLAVKQLTPKSASSVLNGGIRSNSNSPKFDSSKQRVHQHSNSYAPSAATTSTASAKGPSPLAIYSSSANGGLNENYTNNYSKPESPGLDVASGSSTTSIINAVPTTSSSSSSSSSLKIRIKVGGGSESASIIKTDSLSQNVAVVEDDNNAAIFDNNNAGKKLPNGTNDNSSHYHVGDAPPPTGVGVPSPVPADTGGASAAVTSQAKKVRQKRQHTDVDVASPLSLISGRRKMKTTNEYIAEWAPEYPPEMAKSLTKATLEVAVSQQQDVDDDHYSPGATATSSVAGVDHNVVASVNKRSYTKRGGSIGGGHDDYLSITKPEMVANYLNTNFVEDEEANADLSPSYSPTLLSTTYADQHQPRRRGRPRKYPDSHYHHRHTAANPPSVRSMDATAAASAAAAAAAVSGERSLDIAAESNVVKPLKKPVNWYNILNPLDETVDESYTSSNPSNVNTESACSSAVEQKLLDKFWPTTVVDNESSIDVTTVDSTFPNLHSRILTSIGERRVLAMPYVDIGLPDFVEYRYPDSDRYIVHWSER